MNTTSTIIPKAKAGVEKSTHPDTWLDPELLARVLQVVGTPVFIYSQERLLENAHRIRRAAERAGLGNRLKSFIPFFPNSNPHLLRPLYDLGMGVLLQVPGEYAILKRFGIDSFIASPGHLPDGEIDFWVKTGSPLYLSSLGEIEYLLDNHPNAEVHVRIDSLSSDKPGIKYGQLEELAKLLAAYNRKLDSFELYCGSSNSADQMVGFLEQVFMIHKKYFPDLRAIDLAGGYGFDYEGKGNAEKHFEWDRYCEELARTARRYDVADTVDLIIEPARDLLADVGVLILEVKRKPILQPGANQLLTDGSRVLMPSAHYRNRVHNILFFDSQMKELRRRDTRAVMRGKGILRHEQILPGEYQIPGEIGPGDVAVVLDVGAYCATQHMEFLNIPPAAEVLVDDSGPNVITERGGELDKWRNLLEAKRPI